MSIKTEKKSTELKEDKYPFSLTEPHKPTHKVRFVTAASLFDGHDASINFAYFSLFAVCIFMLNNRLYGMI